MATSGMGMNVVTVKKAELLETVKANREKHRSIFLEAVDGYRKRVVELLGQRLADARAGRRINVYFNLPTPVDQTREYDKIIKMLEMSVDTNVELTQSEFSQYVMDDWSWKKQFSAVNSTYTVAAMDDSPVSDEDEN